MLKSDVAPNAGARSATADPVRFGTTRASVLVTGGTGFVGKAVVRALLNDGHAVTVWSRHAAAAAVVLGRQVRCIGDLGEYPDDADCDVVINLAGARILGMPWTAHRRHLLVNSRAGLTDKLVDWIGRRARKPRLLLSGSAIGYYGVQPQDDRTELTEESPPTKEFMSRVCSSWEQAANRAADYGVSVACMRFGVVLGNDGGSLPQLAWPTRLGVGGKLGTGQQWFSWIHLLDLLRAMAHVWKLHAPADPTRKDAGATTETSVSPQTAQAFARPQMHAYNFVSPGGLTQEQFGGTLADVVDRPFWFSTPALPVRLLLGEQADLLLEGQHVVPRRLLDTDFRFEFADARSALTDLLWAGPL